LAGAVLSLVFSVWSHNTVGTRHYDDPYREVLMNVGRVSVIGAFVSCSFAVGGLFVSKRRIIPWVAIILSLAAAAYWILVPVLIGIT
jgi:hypothetical protein